MVPAAVRDRRRRPVPVAGSEAVIACDIVIASEQATFGLSEVNWGILPGGNVSKVFCDMVSFRNALFYAMTGRTIDGRKAAEMGIATMAVPADKLREETVAIARELRESNPYGVRFVLATQGEKIAL